MSHSPTAKMLANAVDISELTQREIANRVGFKHPNILSMLKSGDTRVPLDRIPALAVTLDLDTQTFLLLAIQEYHPRVHEVLVDVLGLPLTDTENSILALYRVAASHGEIEMTEPLRKALKSLFELAAPEPRMGQG